MDASAVVKRYVNEVGSDWVRAATSPASSPLLFTSRMTLAEVISAFARRLREGSLTAAEFGLARDIFSGDCLKEYQVMPPTVAVVELACILLQRYPLRAYDAMHLATALTANSSSRRRVTPPWSSFRQTTLDPRSQRRGVGRRQPQPARLNSQGAMSIQLIQQYHAKVER